MTGGTGTMDVWIANVLLVWQAGLGVVLAVYAVRTRTAVMRNIALSALATVLIAVLALLAAARGQAAFLDAALVVALLAAFQALKIVKRTEKHEERD